MIAILPMYDHPAVRAETDALWAAMRDRLRAAGLDAPEGLTRSDDLFGLWRSPDLLLGQTCGLPMRMELHRRVHLLGSIDYGLEDCPPGWYRSVFLAGRSDPRDSLAQFGGACLAYNEAMSHSGWYVATTAAVRFTPGPVTGSHRDSARAVAEGRAEVAAVDAMSWWLMEQHTDVTAHLKVVGHSAAAPGLALITAFPAFVPVLQRAIAEGIADLSQAQRDALHIQGFVETALADYLAVPIPPTPEAYAAANA